MHDFENIRIGFAMTGSFCTFQQAFQQAEYLASCGAELIPIMSANASQISTRFGEASEMRERLENIAKRKIISSIEDAEPLGPKQLTDIMLVEPCTSNTAAKLAFSITDSPVTMAVKSHLRGQKPVVLAIASNDALAGTLKNIGLLANAKHYYFVPLRQDDSVKKPNSLVADFGQTADTLVNALNGRQLQPCLFT